MAEKLPKATLKELDKIMLTLSSIKPGERDAAMTRLRDFETGGKLPISALIDMSHHSNPTMSMYAIGALGRNGSANAHETLLGLIEEHAAGNILMLETIVDALGECGDTGAVPVLLGLLDIQIKGWKSKLMGRLVKRKDKEEEHPQTEKRREHLTTPVVRALVKLGDPSVVEPLEKYLQHPDAVLRWHMIQLLVTTNSQKYTEQLKEMSESDESDLVKEMAEIALRKIGSLPPHMNN